MLKFFNWLDTFLPHAVIIVCSLVIISAGFYVLFTPGPIVASVTVGMVQLKYLYALSLWLLGAFPIYALATRDVPLFIRSSTALMFGFTFLLVTRLVAVGFTMISWIYLLAFVSIVFLCRMVIWNRNRND